MRYSLPSGLLILTMLITAASAGASMRSFHCEGAEKLSPERARAVVRDVQSKYSEIRHLSARFIQESYSVALDESSRSNGTMLFSRPGRMKWHYRAPEEQVFVIRDDTLWLYQIAERQVVIDQFREVLISELPVAFLMGIGNLERDFRVKGACRNDAGTVLDLEPASAGRTEAGEQVSGFRLLVDSRAVPIGASVTDVGGNVTSIMLTEIETSKPVPDREFATDFPKGTDIIDHRKRA